MKTLLAILMMFLPPVNKPVSVTIHAGQTVVDTTTTHRGGYWSSNNTAIASFGTTRTSNSVTGIAIGTVIVNYIVWGDTLETYTVNVK